MKTLLRASWLFVLLAGAGLSTDAIGRGGHAAVKSGQPKPTTEKEIAEHNIATPIPPKELRDSYSNKVFWGPSNSYHSYLTYNQYVSSGQQEKDKAYWLDHPADLMKQGKQKK